MTTSTTTPPEALPPVEPETECDDSQALDAALDVAAAWIAVAAVWACAFVGVPMVMGLLAGR